MHRLARAIIASALLSGASLLNAGTMQPILYPETRRDALVEEKFGEKIADPFRWLENDVRTDARVAEWVARQNAVSSSVLDSLPQRRWFEDKLRGLLEYERFGLPVKAGGRYFYTRNPGLLNQAQLFVRQGLKGRPRLLIDPNILSLIHI